VPGNREYGRYTLEIGLDGSIERLASNSFTDLTAALKFAVDEMADARLLRVLPDTPAPLEGLDFRRLNAKLGLEFCNEDEELAAWATARFPLESDGAIYSIDMAADPAVGGSKRTLGQPLDLIAVSCSNPKLGRRGLLQVRRLYSKDPYIRSLGPEAILGQIARAIYRSLSLDVTSRQTSKSTDPGTGPPSASIDGDDCLIVSVGDFGHRVPLPPGEDLESFLSRLEPVFDAEQWGPGERTRFRTLCDFTGEVNSRPIDKSTELVDNSSKVSVWALEQLLDGPGQSDAYWHPAPFNYVVPQRYEVAELEEQAREIIDGVVRQVNEVADPLGRIVLLDLLTKEPGIYPALYQEMMDAAAEFRAPVEEGGSGGTWRQIGEELGVTPQAAQHRLDPEARERRLRDKQKRRQTS